MKKIVGHYKRTSIAWAPEELARCTNKYSSDYEAVIVSGDIGATLVNTSYDLKVVSNFDDIDIVHFHNKTLDVDVPNLIQYHSPWYDDVVDKRYSGKKTVIAQYHALLSEYNDCTIVRNVIDFIDNDLYELDYTCDKIKVGFSPSMLIGGDMVESKGYPQTKEILERIKNKYPNFDYDIIIDTPLEECIKRKSKCNVIIDEVVTSSYHRCGLEGLALGKMTICSLSNEVEEVFKKASKSDIIPFKNVYIGSLEPELIKIITNGVEHTNDIGRKNRQWMETYWNPKTIVNEFEDIYNTL